MQHSMNFQVKSEPAQTTPKPPDWGEGMGKMALSQCKGGPGIGLIGSERSYRLS